MAFKDILLGLTSYPEPTPAAAVEQAVGLASALGARISAHAFQIAIPSVGNVLANSVLNVSAMVAAERQKSAANTDALIASFENAAKRRGVAHEHSVDSRPTSQLAAILTERARMHDVTLIPIGPQADLQRYVAESVIFGSGRPTIVYPEAPKRDAALSFDTVCVAWDFGRPAARALADALPILQLAKKVRVVTITREKTINTGHSTSELVRHLALHGIDVVVEEEDAAGRTIGQALEGYVNAREIDILVMGAYGHSRMRDFILGGATKAILADPPAPVLLSH